MVKDNCYDDKTIYQVSKQVFFSPFEKFIVFKLNDQILKWSQNLERTTSTTTTHNNDDHDANSWTLPEN